MAYTIIKRARFDCPWCDKAAELLENTGAVYGVRALGNQKLKEAADAASMSTIPIIYHDDTLIGGYSELAEHLSQSEKA